MIYERSYVRIGVRARVINQDRILLTGVNFLDSLFRVWWGSPWLVGRTGSAAAARELQARAAGRWPRLQAVLLEHGDDLDPVVLQACAPVLSDPNLGAPGPLSVVGRLATLRRWSDRHPGLGELAASACRTAGRDAARALRDPKQWEDLVDELVVFTGDAQILTTAVEQIISVVDTIGGLRATGLDETVKTYYGSEDIERVARQALLSLARCLHTPDDVLLRALPSAPGHFAQDLLELRPHLAEQVQLEILARTGVYFFSRDGLDDPIVVPGDEELAAPVTRPGC